MAEVLLRQLQQILAPWNDLDDATTPPTEVGVGECGQSQGVTPAADPVRHARAITTRLELARAALALFASNAGLYRPILVQLFRFLFDLIDGMRGMESQHQLERMAGGNGAISVTTAAAAEAAARAMEVGGATAEERNAVATAYEKVRLTEGRMAAVVEEAAVQRDLFQSKLDAQKQHQYHLEDLLQHQMELNQTLVDYRLRQETTQHSGGGAGNVGGGVPASFSADYAAGNTAHGRTRSLFAPTSTGGDALFPSTLPDGGVNGAALVSGSRPIRTGKRDEAHVQRLVARAERQRNLEIAEEQLQDLRGQFERFETKVQSLLKLNAKYAHQCMELSARLSLIHEHNIALAADAQLYQRDSAREHQKAAHLEHELFVARGLVLTALQLHKGGTISSSAEMEDEGEEAESNERIPSLARSHSAHVRSMAEPQTIGRGAHPLLPAPPELEARASATSALVPSLPGLPLDEADQFSEALRHLSDVELRYTVTNLLDLQDRQQQGWVKEALLQLLQLQTVARVALLRYGDDDDAEGEEDDEASSRRNAPKWMPAPCRRVWLPPYGHRPGVPHHLRSVEFVRLLRLHPLLAEAIVHELLSQRLELQIFGQGQLAERKAVSKDQQKPAEPPAELHFSTADMGLSLPEFIVLFILVVWCGDMDRYLSLLPAPMRAKLTASSQPLTVAEDTTSSSRAHLSEMRSKALQGPAQTCKSVTVAVTQLPRDAAAITPRTTLIELRHVLHLLRPAFSFSADRLPPAALQLSYALDLASLQLNSGPLTYAYGLVSRGTLSEVLLCLLHAEREALLRMCRAVDAALVRASRSENPSQSLAAEEHQGQKKSEEGAASTSLKEGNEETMVATAVPRVSEGKPARRRSRASVAAAVTPQTFHSEADGDEEEEEERRGWIPSAHLVRLLLLLFPGYPTAKLQRLIAAAITVGTGGAEDSTRVFYEVLLPARMLPGMAFAATTTAESSTTTVHDFAVLFYTFLCEDAVESMQMVEDSVWASIVQEAAPVSFSSNSSDGAESGEDATLRALSKGSTLVTAQQITSLAFLAIPRAEIQHWGAALRSVVNRWSRLRNMPRDPILHGGGSGAGDVARSEEEEGVLSSEQQVGDHEGINEKEADVPAVEHISVFAQVSVAAVVAYLRQNILVRRGPFANSTTLQETTDAAAANTTTPDGGSLEVALSTGWSRIQQRLMQPYEAGWAARLQTLTGSKATPSLVDAAAGLANVQAYTALTQRLLPYRSRSWGTEAVGQGNVFLHPLHYGSPIENAVEAQRRKAAAAVAAAAATAKKAAAARKAKKKKRMT